MWGWQPRQSSLAIGVDGYATGELGSWLLWGFAASPKQPPQQWGEHATGELGAGCHLGLAAWNRQRVKQCFEPAGELAALGYRSLAKAVSVESQPARLGSQVRWGSTCWDKAPGQQDR